MRELTHEFMKRKAGIPHRSLNSTYEIGPSRIQTRMPFSKCVQAIPSCWQPTCRRVPSQTWFLRTTSLAWFTWRSWTGNILIAWCFSRRSHLPRSQGSQKPKQLSSILKWQKNIRLIGRTPTRFFIWWKRPLLRSWLAPKAPANYSWYWPTWMVQGHSLCWCIDFSSLVSQRRMWATLSSHRGIPSRRIEGRASLKEI